mgnify:CR=1 FL=1
MFKRLCVFIIFYEILIGVGLSAQSKEIPLKTENIILITLDGMRWQEVFQGIDKRFFDQEQYLAYHYTHEDFKKEFWRETAEERREVLFPFLWNVVSKQGQLYGNRDKGSNADIINEFHFSYPGYNEILSGIADPRITGNDKILNPNKTYLEWLDNRPEYKGKVAAFASWDVFPYIINKDRTDIFVYSAFEDMVALPDNERIEILNQVQKDTPSPWDAVGLDVFTYNFALEYLQQRRPKALFISFGETDDFAHNGQYDQYILAARRTDDFIGRIWKWVQNDPDYKDKTTLLITTDHGRGHIDLEQWKHHGRFEYQDENGETKLSHIEGDTSIWAAVIGPDTSASGEMENVNDIKQSQFASTLVKFLGLEYLSSHESLQAGEPIETMFK